MLRFAAFGLLTLILVLAAAGCDGPAAGGKVSAGVGPAQVTVGIDGEGRPYVKPSFSVAHFRLGWVTIDAAVDAAQKLSSDKPHVLVVLVQQPDGTYEGAKYDIDEEFKVVPEQPPLFLSASGDGKGRVTVVLRASTSSGPTSGTALTPQVVDKLLGPGNWFCLGGTPNAVKARRLPSFTITGMVREVDVQAGVYLAGDIAPSGGPATVWFGEPVQGSSCPPGNTTITRATLDRLLGPGNWSCLPSFSSAARSVAIPPGFVLVDPVAAIDMGFGTYGPGESVPAGNPATVWLRGTCPG